METQQQNNEPVLKTFMPVESPIETKDGYKYEAKEVFYYPSITVNYALAPKDYESYAFLNIECEELNEELTDVIGGYWGYDEEDNDEEGVRTVSEIYDGEHNTSDFGGDGYAFMENSDFTVPIKLTKEDVDAINRSNDIYLKCTNWLAENNYYIG